MRIEDFTRQEHVHSEAELVAILAVQPTEIQIASGSLLTTRSFLVYQFPYETILLMHTIFRRKAIPAFTQFLITRTQV